MADEKLPKIMEEPLPQILQELEKSINTAKEAATDARKAAEEVKQASQVIPRELIRRIVTSKDFLIFMVILILATIMSAVSISLGLSLISR